MQPVLPLGEVLNVVAIGCGQDDQARGHTQPATVMDRPKAGPNLDGACFAVRGVSIKASDALHFDARPRTVRVLVLCVRLIELAVSHDRIRLERFSMDSTPLSYRV